MQIGQSWPEYIYQHLADSTTFGNIPEKNRVRREREKHAAEKRAGEFCGLRASGFVPRRALRGSSVMRMERNRE